MIHKEVIGEIMNGNGNKYTVKEILSAHIRDGKDFEKYVRGQFKEGQTLMAVNRTKISSISKILKYGVAPTIFLIITYLLGVRFIP